MWLNAAQNKKSKNRTKTQLCHTQTRNTVAADSLLPPPHPPPLLPSVLDRQTGLLQKVGRLCPHVGNLVPIPRQAALTSASVVSATSENSPRACTWWWPVVGRPGLTGVPSAPPVPSPRLSNQPPIHSQQICFSFEVELGAGEEGGGGKLAGAGVGVGGVWGSGGDRSLH